MTFWTNSTFEPKRAFTWKMSFASAQGTAIETFYCKKVSRPKVSLQEAEHKYLNRSYYFPGHVSWEPVTVTLVDSTSNLVISKLTEVMKLGGYKDLLGDTIDKNKFLTINKQNIGQATSTAGGASVDVTIQQINNAGLTVEEYVLKQAWIKSITPSELSYDTEDLASYDVEIRYDWCVVNITPA